MIKCVCSGWFILTGIASAALSGGVLAYALFVLLGLTASFWGDFFLQLEDQEKYFVVGVFCFMAAHLLYITAFSLAAEKLFPERPFLSFWQAAAVAVVMAGLLIMILTARLKLGKMFVPGMMYIAAISLMFIKAVSLGLFAFFSLPALTGTAALVTLIATQLVHVFECKSERLPLSRIKLLNNPFMLIAVLISAGVTAAAVYIPALRLVFGTVPLGWGQLGIIAAATLLVPVVSGIYKRISAKR